MIEKEKKTRDSVKIWWDKYQMYVISCGIILLTMAGVMIAKQFWPFGKYLLYCSDFKDQGFPYAVEMRNKLLEGESIFHTWHTGYGSNFFSNIVLYFNPILLLFMIIPEKWILVIPSITYPVTLCLLNCSMIYFLTHRPKRRIEHNHSGVMIFSLSYALCMYVISNMINWNFLITAACFPLIILGLENYVAGKGWKLYSIWLAIAFFSCYYMTGLFCVFILLYYFTLEFGDAKNFVKKSLGIIGLSALAIAVSGLIILPVAVQMMNQTYSISEFKPDTWFVGFFDLVKYVFAFNYPVLLGSSGTAYGEANLYYGMLPLMLTSLYIFQGNIPVKERLKKIILLAIYAVALNFNLLNYVFHLFHYPSWFPNRFSWFMILLAIIMAADVWTAAREEEYKGFSILKIVGITLLWVALALGCSLFAEQIDYLFTFWMSIGILFVFMIGLLTMNLYPRPARIVMTVLAIVELVASFSFGTIMQPYDMDMDTYLSHSADVRQWKDELDLPEANGFSRTNIEGTISMYNGGMAIQENGTTAFSSSIGEVGYFLDGVGVFTGSNVFAQRCYTPITMSMLGVQYVVNGDEYVKQRVVSQPPYKFLVYQGDGYEDLEVVDRMEYYTLLENPDVLSIGYMIRSDADQTFMEQVSGTTYIERGILENINIWLDATTGVENVIQIMELEPQKVEINNGYLVMSGERYCIFHESAKELYEQMNEGDKYAYTGEYDPEGQVIMGLTYQAPEDGVYYIDTLEEMHCTKYLKKGETFMVVSGVEEKNFGTEGYIDTPIRIGKVDEQQWQMARELLADEQLQVTEYEAGSLKGTIEVKEDGLFYTSIPYDANWTLYVDGEKREIETIWGNSFITTTLTPGVHEIEFRYQQKGFVAGVGISLLAIMGFVALYLLEKKKKAKE